MSAQILTNSSLQFAHASFVYPYHVNTTPSQFISSPIPSFDLLKSRIRNFTIKCSTEPTPSLRTCKNCKTQFDVSLNHPRACRYHTAHFGGETKRKFESVYSGGTMSTPDAGKVYQYWHCCGSEDAFDPGCTAAPHYSYDD